MVIFSVLCPSSESLLLRTFEHRPVVLGKTMVSDLDRLSLRCYFYLPWPVIYLLSYHVFLWFSFDLSTATTSLTIHLSRNMTTFAFSNTAITRFMSYSLPLTNLQAHDFRFLHPHIFLLDPLYLGNVIHIYSFKYLLFEKGFTCTVLAMISLPFRLYNWIFPSLPLSQVSQSYPKCWVMPEFSGKQNQSMCFASLHLLSSTFPYLLFLNRLAPLVSYVLAITWCFLGSDNKTLLSLHTFC